MEASQLPGGEGGMEGESALELGVATFFFWGAGASQLWSWVLLLSTVFFRGRGASQLLLAFGLPNLV